MSSQQTDTSYLNKMTVVVFSGIGLVAAVTGILQIEVCPFPVSCFGFTNTKSCFKYFARKLITR